jgi:hypothetical protein
MLNLVISFILEIFADVGQVVEKVHSRHDMVLKLRQNFDEYAYIDEIGDDVEDENYIQSFNNLTQISVDNVDNSQGTGKGRYQEIKENMLQKQNTSPV